MFHNFEMDFNTLQPYQMRLQHSVCADGFEMPMTVVGKGTPVLLLHAFGMDARQFLPFILPLVNQHCFYLPHFRGFGLSSKNPTTQFNFIEQYADDIDILLADICSQHQVASIDVAAISMGGLVMWAYFHRYLQNDDLKGDGKDSSQLRNLSHLRVKRYLNIDQSPIIYNLPDWQGGVFGDKQEEIFAQFKAVLDVVLPHLQNDDTMDFSHLPYHVKREITDMERAFSLLSVGTKHAKWLINISQYQSPRKLALHNHNTWRQKIRCLQAYLALPYDYRTNIDKLTIPVTLLIGSESTLYEPKWQHKIASILPNAKAIEIQGAGHAIPMDAPLAFTRTLKHFLQAPPIQ